MKTLLYRFFIENWPRKIISVVLAIIIWFTVNQSLIISKTITNVPVRVINIPEGKTIVDLQSNGTLTKRVTLSLVGDKTILSNLVSNDLEVVIDAQDKSGEWIAPINKRNLISLSPNINIGKGISRVHPTSVTIRLTKLLSEKIPIFVTQPIGEAPKDYQFLDIWPPQLSLSVSGPEEIVRRLKTKGIRLTFDLTDVTKAQLDAIASDRSSTQDNDGNQVSFFIPEQWKRVNIPLLSDIPLEIDDPKAKLLRIDFVRIALVPIQAKIPISLYFPTGNLSIYNPQTIVLEPRPFIEKAEGLYLFSQSLFAKGVSQLFVRVVEQMIQMSITIDETKGNQPLNWSIEFINPRLLEDRYITLMMSDNSDEEVRQLQPLLREEYLRNQFRSYMSQFHLYKSDEKKLELTIRLDQSRVIIDEGTSPLPHALPPIQE